MIAVVGRRAVLAGVLASVAAGCLPKSSLARRDEIEADLYALTLDVAVRTEGLDLAPFTWHLEGTVGWSYTRSFRDGSLGHLVRFEGMKAAIVRDGVATPVATPLDGAFVELRAFPDGQLLMVSGASTWAGNPGHAEVIDVLWPALSPHLPGSRAEARAPFLTSWPTWVEGGPKLRTRLEAQWTPAGDTWTYAGTLSGQAGYVDVGGKAQGTVELGSGSTRLRAHTFEWTRTVTTTWASGARITQHQDLRGALRHTGTAPAPLLDMPTADSDAAADARPLHLRDGRRVEARPVDQEAALPFLLLPDDLTEDEYTRLRTAVTGAGSM